MLHTLTRSWHHLLMPYGCSVLSATHTTRLDSTHKQWECQAVQASANAGAAVAVDLPGQRHASMNVCIHNALQPYSCCMGLGAAGICRMQDCTAALTLLAFAQPESASCKPEFLPGSPTCCLSMQPHPLHLPQAIGHLLLLGVCPGHHLGHICLQAVFSSPIPIGLNVQPRCVSIRAALYARGYVVRLQSSKQCRYSQIYAPGVACQGLPTAECGPEVGQVPAQQQSRHTLRDSMPCPRRGTPGSKAQVQ